MGRPTKYKYKKKADGVTNDTGAPTKYKPEYCKQIVEYFSIEPTYESPVTITYKNGTTIEKTERKPNELKFLENFAWNIGVAIETLENWAKKYKDFFRAFTRAKALQKQHLITCGLLGLYNSDFAKFTAKNITDMRDEQNLNLKGGFNLTIVCNQKPQWMNKREQLINSLS